MSDIKPDVSKENIFDGLPSRLLISAGQPWTVSPADDFVNREVSLEQLLSPVSPIHSLKPLVDPQDGRERLTGN